MTIVDSLLSSSDSRVLIPLCIFCEKDKYVKGTNSKEKLVKCCELRADETIKQRALQICEANILASREVVAAEAHYHRTCYRDYTRPSAVNTKCVT